MELVNGRLLKYNSGESFSQIFENISVSKGDVVAVYFYTDEHQTCWTFSPII